MFNVTDLHTKNYESKQKFIINQGGTGSGKTYALLQLLFTYAMLQPNLVITVVGQDIPNLKKGAFRDAMAIFGVSDELSNYFTKINQTDRVFNCINGSIIEFSSFSNEQDAKSGKRDYLFINEADGIPYDVFWQLAIRTRNQIFLDYNPTSRFWVHDKLIGKENTELIISDHRHNPFLSEEMHRMIESIEDDELFKVYARGLTGKLQGLIYTNWNIVDKMPDSGQRWIGIDFGFTNDPTAIIDVRLSDGELWIDEICYSRKMLNSDIINLLKEENLLRIPTVADSAEPKSIEEMKRSGIMVEPAEKGKDSVNAGIDLLKRYKLNVTRRSINVKKELSSYMWKKDKTTGDFTNTPIGYMDHALDALRYVALNKLGRNQKSGRLKIRLGKLPGY